MAEQPDLFRTLADARNELTEKLDEGTTCPCCGQYARRYRRKLNSTMAAGLLWLTRAGGHDSRSWVEAAQNGPKWLVSKGGTLATLAHWGLIEARPNWLDDRKRASGVWRVTSAGLQFARGELDAPKYVLLYNNEIHGFSEERFDIRAALGDAFSYDEMMGLASH